MPMFIPITIHLNHKAVVVSSIADAAKALEQPWPKMNKPARLKAIRLITECIAGHCSQQAAFDAFKSAAREQRLLGRRPSGGRTLDQLLESTRP
jgi:hypothetical protein